MFKGIKVTTRHVVPNKEKFNEKELTLYDIEGNSRWFLEVEIPEYNPNIKLAIKEIINNQYKLPAKYIECVDYRYCSKKYEVKNNNIVGYLYIEPLNKNYPNYIRYMPINQSLPLNTSVILDIDTEKLGLEPNFYGIWSNNLQTDSDIANIIKKENPKSITLQPWPLCYDIGSIDIDSKIYYKGKVSYVNNEMCNSISLFGFKRNDNKHYFKIFTYDCFNITPANILELMTKQPGISKETIDFCNYILAKATF